MPVDLLTLPALGTLVSGADANTMVSIPFWLEALAIVVSAVSGVLAARERKLDLVGAVCLAVTCSLGGGLLRDMVLQVDDVYLLNQPMALPAAIVTAAVVFLIPSVIAKQDRLIAVLDIFAVGLYAATGADKALVYSFSPIICIMMGFFTGVGGGMLRDVFLGEVPQIFRPSNFYAMAAIGGAASYTLLAGAGVSHLFALVVCVAVTMLLRWVSLRYNITSPSEVDLARAGREALRQSPLARSAMGAQGHSDRRGDLADLRRGNLQRIARREQERRAQRVETLDASRDSLTPSSGGSPFEVHVVPDGEEERR